MFLKKVEEPEYAFLKGINWDGFVFESQSGGDKETLIVKFDDKNKIIGINSRQLFGAAVSSIVACQGMDELGNINDFGEQLEMAYDIFLDTPFIK